MVGQSQEWILLVEDSEFHQRFYQRLLEREGLRVVVVGSGEEAIEMVQERHPTLILLDLQLPGVDGFHVCAAVRDNPETHAIPIIILTTRTEVPSVMAGLSGGADDYVGKQEDTATLVARIQRQLERTRTHKRISQAERLELLREATGVISPGIRTPLAEALARVEILESYSLSEPTQKRALDYLRRYLERVLRLVQNIEEVSKVASRTFVARQQLMDIETALDEAELLAHDAEDRAAHGAGGA